MVLSDGFSFTQADVERELTREERLHLGSLAETTSESEGGGSLDEKRREAERIALASALRRAHNNRTLAARLLGISRRALYNKLEEFGLLQSD